MSEVEFKKFATCDTCGVETLCREDGEDDQCGGCYWAPINHAKHQSELSALREELAEYHISGLEALEKILDLTGHLAAAEKRNAALVELLRDARDLVRPSAVLSPVGEFARVKTRLDAALLHYPAPSQPVRILGLADAAWLLYDKGFYGQHAVLAMDAATILQKATSYAGYKPTESGASE